MHNHNDRDIDISDPMRSLGNSSNERKDYTGSLRDGILVTLIFFVIEVAGGYYSGSLSLISDAGHMFIDASALLMSLAAIRGLPVPCQQRNGHMAFTEPRSLLRFVTGFSWLS
jgi:cobalt-zinc-cadmium efflux system protein